MKHYKLSYQSPQACLWRYWWFDFAYFGMMGYIRLFGFQLNWTYKI
jgi:hypothetical protein